MTLSRGQFFAVLRLVLHVRGGAELDRNLVFKQGSYRHSPSFVTVPSSLVENYPDYFPSMTADGAGD